MKTATAVSIGLVLLFPSFGQAVDVAYCHRLQAYWNKLMDQPNPQGWRDFNKVALTYRLIKPSRAELAAACAGAPEYERIKRETFATERKYVYECNSYFTTIGGQRINKSNVDSHHAKLMEQFRRDRDAICAEASKADAPSVPSAAAGTAEKNTAGTSCSSVDVGQAKQCISVQNIGRTEYRVSASCPGSYLAAVTSVDAEDKCERQVVSVSTGNPTTVYSYFGKRPQVLDAVPATDSARLKCYQKRHGGGPC